MPLPPPDPLQGSRDRSGLPPDGPPLSEEVLRTSHRLSRAVVAFQAALLRRCEAHAALERLFVEVLAATGSTTACLVEAPLEEGDETAPRLRARLPAAPDVEHARELQARLEALCTRGGSGGDGGPALLALPLLALPLEVEGSRVGALGVGGRPGGYAPGSEEALASVLAACGLWLLQEREARRHEARAAPRPPTVENLKQAMDHMQLGLWFLELVPEPHITFHNPCWLGMLGYSPGELEPSLQTWMRLIHPEDVAAIRERISYSPDAGNILEYEQRLRHRDGQWRWLLTRRFVVARDARGQATRIMGTNMDITSRKREEQRLRVLVDILPDLIFRIGADGTYRDHYLNPRVMSESVVSRDRIIGYNLRQLPTPPSSLDKIQQHLARAIRDGTPQLVEYPLDLPIGRAYYEMRLVRCAPDEAVAIVRNVTERKQTEDRLRQHEEQLRHHRDSLEELVRSRSEKLMRATLELEGQQAQLIQTEKMASLGQMAAGVAHEINNPVSYVMSNLGTLDQYVSSLSPLLAVQRELLASPAAPSAPLAPELVEHMRELWRAGDVDFLLEDMPQLVEESLAGTRRIKEIVQGLRSFAREDTGEPQLVDVNQELAATLKIVWNELKYKCDVKRDFGPLPPVSCHPTQISQVFTNLLVNAAQAIETRGEIRIRTRLEGGEVVVEISDTGKGMSPETLSKLFTPFFTTKPRGQGTGLGLSVSYGIISRHHGRIDVQSEPGKGSTFTIRLPATRTDAPQDTETSTDAAGGSSAERSPETGPAHA